MINKVRNIVEALSNWLDDRPSDRLFCFVITILLAEVLILIYMIISLEKETLEMLYHVGSLAFFLAATCLAYIEIVINRKTLRINARKEYIDELKKNRDIVLNPSPRSGRFNPCKKAALLNNEFVDCKSYRDYNGTLNNFKIKPYISSYGTRFKIKIENKAFSEESRALVISPVDVLVDQYLDNIEFVLNYAGRKTAERLNILVMEDSENSTYGAPTKILNWVDEAVHTRINKKTPAQEYFDDSYNKIMNYINSEISKNVKATF